MFRSSALLLAFAVSTIGTSGIASGATHPDFTHGITTSVHKVNPSASAGSAKATPSGSHFVSIAPDRLFDTRTDQPKDGPIPADRALEVDFNQDFAPVSAVVLNLTVTNSTQNTYVTGWSGGTALPVASSLNVRAGETRANQVTVPLSTKPDGSKMLLIYNHSGSVDLIGDVAGVYLTGDPEQGEVFTGYQPSAVPARLLDTRNSGGPIGGGRNVKLDLSAKVPADADSVTVNLTAIAHSQGGFLTLYPGDSTRGSSSSINVNAGETTPNLVTVQLGADKSLGLYNSAGSTDAIVDLVGAYSPSATALYYPTEPRRLLDTRDGSGSDPISGALGQGEIVNVLDSAAPDGAVAETMNLTGVGPRTATYLTTWPTGNRPATSNLNLTTGQTASNAATTGVSDGSVNIYNNAGVTPTVLDTSGYFLTP